MAMGASSNLRAGGPVRVAHVMGKMVGGGVEQVVMNYYRRVDRSRVQFDFLVDADSTLVPGDEIESLGGRVFEVPPYQRQIAYQRGLSRLLRAEGWPVVHSHVNALSVFPLRAAKAAGVPVRIAHSHSTAGGHDPIKNALKAALRPFANCYPTHRAACTSHAGEWLFREAQFRIVPNAIDLCSFRFDAGRRVRTRALLGFGDEQYVVGHVGRFSPPKNQGALIRAFSRIVGERTEARLVLVGEGKQRKEQERLASALCPEGSVLFLGQREDIEDLYCAFDVFCLPSEFEGLGMVAVEAEASGLPCILSSAVPRDADPAGTAVFLPPNDEEAWANAILAAAFTPRHPVDSSSFATYDIASQAIDLQSWYEQLAREASGVDVR